SPESTAVIRSHRFCLALTVVTAACGWNLFAADPDLSEYRTVETAIAAKVAKPGATASTRPGFLGLLVGLNPQGKLAVTEVAAESPAFRAGVRAGDILLGLNGAVVKDEDSFYDLLRARSLGEAIK